MAGFNDEFFHLSSSFVTLDLLMFIFLTTPEMSEKSGFSIIPEELYAWYKSSGDLHEREKNTEKDTE